MPAPAARRTDAMGGEGWDGGFWGGEVSGWRWWGLSIYCGGTQGDVGRRAGE